MREAGSRGPLVVGLTGGIGSGKSAVADEFAASGIDITDSDALAHALTAPGEPGYEAVLAAFGPEYRRPDGTLDRAGLRRRVFADQPARERLEGILHPLIRAAARREVATWRSPYGLLVVPLLLERGNLSAVDRVLVVDCPEDEQVRRVMAEKRNRRSRGAGDHGHTALPARRGSRARTTPWTTPDPRARSPRRSRHSIAAIGLSPRREQKSVPRRAT